MSAGFLECVSSVYVKGQLYFVVHKEHWVVVFYCVTLKSLGDSILLCKSKVQTDESKTCDSIAYIEQIWFSSW